MMKSSIAVLYILVSLCLVFSLTALLIVANDHGYFEPINPTNTPAPYAPAPSTTYSAEPTPIQESTPPPSPANTVLTINYEETSREENNDWAKITLTVTATYQSGDQITIDYSQFYLNLYVFRLYPLSDGTTNYPNTGTITLGPHHTTQTFKLTYEYGTTGFNGMDPSRVYYQLACHSTATIDWANQDYHK